MSDIDDQLPDLPPAGRNNFWYRSNDSDTVIVFVHGFLSDSRNSWLHRGQNSVFWPDLVATDHRFNNPAIFLAGYHTSFRSGSYQIRHCTDELFGAIQRTDTNGVSPPLSKPRIVFVCHSAGGIVVRYMLEHRKEFFADKHIGLFLVASPSYGSRWANTLSFAALLFSHAFGLQLKWGNFSLQDLDDRFKELVYRNGIPGLRGAEYFENYGVIPFFPFRRRTLVVEKLSAGRYFGAPKLLADTDHVSCVKPSSMEHPAHHNLIDFVTENEFVATGAPNALPSWSPLRGVLGREHVSLKQWSTRIAATLAVAALVIVGGRLSGVPMPLLSTNQASIQTTPISYNEFVNELLIRQDQTKRDEFVNEHLGKRVRWKCQVFQADVQNRRYMLVPVGLDADSRFVASALLAESQRIDGSLNPVELENGRRRIAVATVEGTLQRVTRISILLWECQVTDVERVEAD
jgi:pimeloyl-ACP methyl ester carboxylesterase